MFLVVILVAVVVVLLVLAGAFFNEKNTGTAGLFLVFGVMVLCIMTFAVVPNDLSWGVPADSIGVGEYKLGFIYVAGDNVTVGVELPTDNEEEQLFVYQFGRNAFDGEVNIDSRTLWVVKTGGFKKLVLK